MKVNGARLFLDGVDVGATEVRAPSLAGNIDTSRAIEPIGPIELELSFRPNWVGIWKLQAAIAASPPD